ncbi:MAG: glycosyltransferase family 2 protein [Actinomycetota bacterium]
MSGDVGAVVVNFNCATTIRRCLDSLLQEPQIRRVVVVDNASSDGSWEQIPPEMLIRNSQNVGFAAAVNQGVAGLPGCSFILLLNPDAWLCPGAVTQLKQALTSEHGVGAAGPRITDEHGETVVSGRRFPSALVDALAALRLTHLLPRTVRVRVIQGSLMPTAGHPVKTDWICGACMLVRSSVWTRLGGFSEEFFLYGEELDWCWRSSKRGLSCLYVPDALVQHVGGVSADTVFSSSEVPARVEREIKRACQRNMSPSHYFAWSLVQRWLVRRGQSS